MNAPGAISFSQIVAAGATLTLQMRGAQFYFTLMTGPLFVRPNPGGNYCKYVQGQGGAVNFTSIDIQNPNSFAVVFQVFATPGDFIDKRLIPDQVTQNVVVAAPAFGGGEFITVTDKSGQSITDASGNSWIAITRVLLSVQVLESGDKFSISQSGTTIAWVSNPDGPYTISAAGPFVVAWITGSGDPYAIFEIYQAVAPGFAGQPPN